MSSLQQHGPSSKSTKFVAANPLDPMLRPFEQDGMNDDDKDLQSTLAKNVNERLEKTIKDLQEKHQRGTNEVDDPDRAPTGPAYRAMAAMQQQQQQQQQQRAQAAAMMQNTNQKQQQQQNDDEVFRLDRLRQQVDRDLNIQNDNDNNDDDDDDDEFDDLLLSDPALDALRERRLQELKLEHAQKQADLARGHGQYRTISQDEFLPETCTHTTSEFVAVHFCEESFEKCKVLDHYLQNNIAPFHLKCKFLRIVASKAPFFCTKLQIRTLPTLIIFSNGKVVDRLTGFEGIQPDQASQNHQHLTTTLGSFSKKTNDNANSDELDVNKLLEWLAKTGAIEYKKAASLFRSKETKTTGVYSSRLTREYHDDS